MALWYIPCRSTTRWEEIMAQIAIPRLPQAPEEYDPSQINSMINTIDLLIQVLNSSYTPEQLRSETEALVWFGV